jgi:hypothetical protein
MSDRPSLPLDGETALAALIDDGLALVAGAGDSLPAKVSALLNGDAALACEAAAVSWRRGDGSADAPFGFAALVPLAALGGGRLKGVVFRRGGATARYTLTGRASGLDAAFRAILEDAGSAAGSVVDGLAGALLAGRPGARRRAALAGLLGQVARNDGFVEVLGHFEEGEVFLQGWTTELPAVRTGVVAVAGMAHLGEVVAAAFPRDDIGDRGRGYAGLLTLRDRIESGGLERLYFRGRDGWRTIEVYERRVLVPPADAPAHVRAVLPRLIAPAETMHALRLAANRFDGRDTVSELRQPVRVGIDFALAVDGGGMLVSGWLLDPEGAVASATVKAGGAGARIDESWTRQPRPDVTQAFGEDRLFAGLDRTRHSHGFLAFAPRLAPASGAPAYLELEIAGGLPAYCPLSPVRATARQALTRLLSALDPRTAAATSAIERQFGPMLQTLAPASPRAVETIDVGTFDEEAPLSIVIGADERIGEVGVLLSILALDPETRARPIILAGPLERMDEVGSELRRLAGFYRLAFRMVPGEAVEDVCDALEAGISATRSESVVLLSGNVLPRAPGWLGKLERIHRGRGGKCVVSPTMLFEDDSIRWAGTWLEGEGQERVLAERCVGYPRASVSGLEPTEVTAATVECCVMPRAAFAAVEGFTRGYIGASEKGLDLALKLKLAGTPSVWAPNVEMLCAEEDVGAAVAPARLLARRVDRWAFDRRWSLAVSNMRS